MITILVLSHQYLQLHVLNIFHLDMTFSVQIRVLIPVLGISVVTIPKL